MALKRILTTPPDASLAPLYKQVGAEWHLDLESSPDAGPSAKEKELRDNNIVFLKERDAALAKSAQLEAELVARDKAHKGEPSMAERVMQLEKIAQESNQRAKDAEQRYKTTAWESEFKSAATALKIRDDNATRALIAIAKTAAQEKEGVGFVFTDGQGGTLFAKGTDKPLSVQGWLEEQKVVYPDFFSQPQGGGGRGSNNQQSSGRIQLTADQLRKPTEEQRQQIAKGLVDEI